MWMGTSPPSVNLPMVLPTSTRPVESPAPSSEPPMVMVAASAVMLMRPEPEPVPPRMSRPIFVVSTPPVISNTAVFVTAAKRFASLGP